MKTFVLIISERFPATHKRAGEDTAFEGNILFDNKIHTIRANYPLWEKRIKQVNAGEAVLSLRVWSGKPYRSKQREIFYFTRAGIEKLKFSQAQFVPIVINGDCYAKPDPHKMAKNDGLSMADFEDWFKGYDKTKPMAIIHFSNFRYL